MPPSSPAPRAASIPEFAAYSLALLRELQRAAAELDLTSFAQVLELAAAEAEQIERRTAESRS
ncbi:MAG TPA: hypothetical protein VG889_15615 [Rhizomicrobium sp.]|nr:hypothetical protein [Rhizomicrobium sp.]